MWEREIDNDNLYNNKPDLKANGMTGKWKRKEGVTMIGIPIGRLGHHLLLAL